MAKALLLKKGYTIRITSWENDGDDYNTIDYHSEDKKHIDAVIKMLQNLMVSRYEKEGAVGNTYGEDIKETVVSYVLDNPDLLPKWDISNMDEDQIFDLWNSLEYQLLGSSNEEFECRVFESYIGFYTPEDIFVESF